MKKLFLTTILSIFALVTFAAGEAEIKFEKTLWMYSTSISEATHQTG